MSAIIKIIHIDAAYLYSGTDADICARLYTHTHTLILSCLLTHQSSIQNKSHTLN